MLEAEDHDTIVPDDLEHSSLGVEQLLTEKLLLLLVALDDVCGRTSREELGAVLAGCLSVNVRSGSRIRREREEEQEIGGRAGQGALPLAVILSSCLSCKGGVVGQVASLENSCVDYLLRQSLLSL